MTRNRNNAQIQPILGGACTRIVPQSAGQTAKACRLPSFYMVNARSIKKKLDEFSSQLTTSGVDVGAIMESWLHSYIDSAYISIPGYVLYRRDRPDREGGGVCASVTTGILCKRRTDLEHPVFECIWLWLRPNRLPRPLSGIICKIVYFPEALAQENRDRVSYLIETLDSVGSAHPDCGVIICGDFNTLAFSDVLAHHNLKQIFRDPTRGNSILDLILTVICNRYDKPGYIRSRRCVLET